MDRKTYYPSIETTVSIEGVCDRGLFQYTFVGSGPTNQAVPGRFVSALAGPGQGVHKRCSTTEICKPNAYGYFLLDNTKASVPYYGGPVPAEGTCFGRGLVCFDGKPSRYNILVDQYECLTSSS